MPTVLACALLAVAAVSAQALKDGEFVLNVKDYPKKTLNQPTDQKWCSSWHGAISTFKSGHSNDDCLDVICAQVFEAASKAILNNVFFANIAVFEPSVRQTTMPIQRCFGGVCIKRLAIDMSKDPLSNDRPSSSSKPEGKGKGKKPPKQKSQGGSSSKNNDGASTSGTKHEPKPDLEPDRHQAYANLLTVAASTQVAATGLQPPKKMSAFKVALYGGVFVPVNTLSAGVRSLRKTVLGSKPSAKTVPEEKICKCQLNLTIPKLMPDWLARFDALTELIPETWQYEGSQFLNPIDLVQHDKFQKGFDFREKYSTELPPNVVFCDSDLMKCSCQKPSDWPPGHEKEKSTKSTKTRVKHFEVDAVCELTEIAWGLFYYDFWPADHYENQLERFWGKQSRMGSLQETQGYFLWHTWSMFDDSRGVPRT